MPTLLRNRQEALLRGWIELLPEELLQVRPVLSNGYVAALLSTGTIEGVDRHLQYAERWLDGSDADEGTEAPPTRMLVADDAEFRRLPAGTAVHRAGLSLVLGDLAGTVAHAHRALALFDECDEVGRGAASALIGIAAWTGGDLETAHEAYAECTARLRRAGHLSDVLGLLDHARRTSGSPRAGCATRCAPTSRPWSRDRPRAGRAGAARDTLTCTSG